MRALSVWIVLMGSAVVVLGQPNDNPPMATISNTAFSLAKLESLLQEKTKMTTNNKLETKSSLQDNLGQLTESVDTLSTLYELLQQQQQEEIPVYFQELVRQTMVTVNQTRDITAQFMKHKTKASDMYTNCLVDATPPPSKDKQHYAKQHLQNNPKLAHHWDLHRVFGGSHYSSAVDTKLNRLLGGDSTTGTNNKRNNKRRKLLRQFGLNIPSANIPSRSSVQTQQQSTQTNTQQQQTNTQAQPQQQQQQTQQQQTGAQTLQLNHGSNIPHANSLQPHQITPQTPQQANPHGSSWRAQLSRGRNSQAEEISAEPSEAMVEQCVEFVECVRDYTLYDFLIYFVWDDITDDGTIDQGRNGMDPERILDKAEDILEALGQFKDELEDTEYLPQKCNGMLRLFNRNQEHDGYMEFEPATWKDVCAAKKTSKYVSFESIQESFGEDAAGQVFEDFIVCTERLMGDAAFEEHSIFFDHETNYPRLPIGFKPHAFDRHGQLTNIHHYYEFGTYPVFDQRFPCIEDPHKDLRDFMIEANRPYLSGQTDTFVASRHEVDQKIACEEPEQGLLANCSLYLDDEFQCDARFREEPEQGDKEITSIYWNFDHKDDVAELLVGDKVPAGSVCTVTELEGFCCLDLPLQNKDEWGATFDCSEGEDACTNPAPPLAGFSEQTCSRFSGTYCKKPKGCGVLKECIEDAISFAEEFDMTAYKRYLEDAPEIEDDDSPDDCGAARSYFGFDESSESDDDICEAILSLMDNEDFQRLDYMAQTKSLKPELDDEEEPDDLDDPPPPEKTSEYYEAMNEVIYRAELNVLATKDFFNAADSFDCGAYGVAGSQDCASIQNAVVATILFALGRVERAHLSLKYNFVQEDAISDYDMAQMYNNVMVIHGNQKKLFDLIENQTEAFLQAAENATENAISAATTANDVKDIVESIQQSLQRSQRRLARGDDCEEDSVVPTLEVPPYMGFRRNGVGNYTVEGSIFKSPDEAVRYLEQSLTARDDHAGPPELAVQVSPSSDPDRCSMLASAVPARLRHCNGKDQLGKTEWFKVSVDQEAPVVNCGFHSQKMARSSNDGKTLFLEQQPGVELVDTGFFLEANDACDASLRVEIAVASNELTQESTAMLASTRGPNPKLYVAPSKCDQESSRFCVTGEVVPTRYYDVVVTATDSAGWQSSDTCRIVIMSSEEARELRGTTTEYESAQDTTVFNIDSLTLTTA
ncbi:expressed unknown protein [Seminavis robusta]|uniref:Uncharacterized protein n=1 Tax=Seminavis robusta TaxID=568900 RepID=A0A9N8E2C5_9STRA|nr:expressed unknown protein [Seminavis robusta]|eukprot:Sro486_g152680.1 n/a (1212) ;mRNA; f:42242-46641